jgi:hypothetical protein
VCSFSPRRKHADVLGFSDALCGYIFCLLAYKLCLLSRLQRKNGEASPEWVFVGGELLPDEVERAFAKDGKDVKWKNLSLAAVRTAALDLVNSTEMPETDFGKFGGNKERLPPSLLNMTR